MPFHQFLFADYSGAESEAAQRKAIALWSCEAGDLPRKLHAPGGEGFTRATLRARILEELRKATAHKRRVLFGLDHQWSWPRDLWKAAGLETLPWREALDALVEGEGPRPPLGLARDFPKAFNAFAGADIFHCRVVTQAKAYGLPKESDWAGDPNRLTEGLLPGAKPATRLGGIGAVAGQTLAGLLELHLLLREAEAEGLAVRAWPFEADHDPGRGHLGLEVYPGAFNRGEKSDDADARACCAWAQAEQAAGHLGRRLDLRGLAPEALARVRLEGWILGADPGKLAP